MPNNSSGKPWTAADMPDLSGKTIIVTGGNSGIGYEAALEFARKRADVILACRSAEKANAAADGIKKEVPDAKVGVMALDLSSLASIRTFAGEFHRQHKKLDVLCNNAGVMAIPLTHTTDGFEMQIGTNHLGHFALTGRLIDLILATPGARVVNVSSGAHRMGKIRFDDLNWEHGYRKWAAYGQSKLANLLFTLELQHRLEAAGANAIAVACHPGYAATNLQGVSAKSSGSTLMEAVFGLGNMLFSQSAAMGALPTEYAAVSPEIHGGDYIGPNGLGEMWGHPVKVGCTAAAQDAEAAKKLWDLSERLTEVHYEALAGRGQAASAPRA
ncbi:MAG TPA: oxidoreductase [Candidatus Binataceae bacterium]|nr:oxidoreductase [Candidatus Binataceae bacterium]